MNDFQNISKESSIFNLNNTNFLNSIKIINDFFIIFLLDYKNYIFNLNNNISSIFRKKIENLVLCDFLNNLKKTFDLYINNSNDLINSINLEIIKPFSKLVKNYEKSIKESEIKFNDLNNKLNLQNRKLNSSFLKYNASFFNLKNKKDEKEKNFLVSKFFNFKNLYNYELTKINFLIDESNKDYNILINDSNKNKIEIFDKVKTFALNFNQQFFGINLKEIENQFINSLKGKDTINQFSNTIKTNNENRFKYEKFKDINIKELNDDNNNNNNNNNNLDNEFEVINMIKEFEIKSNKNNEIKNIDKIINEYLSKLLCKEEYDIFYIQSFIKFLKEKTIKYDNNIQKENNNFEIFIIQLNNKYENKDIIFKNNNNLIHFGNILNSAIVNLYENFNKNITFFIILIKIIIKTYSSEFILSFYLIKINKIFLSENFWKNLFMFEIITNINNFIENDLKQINEENLKNKKFQYNSILFSYLKYLNKFKSLEKLSDFKKSKLEDFIFGKLNLLIKEYLNYFSKFKVSLKVSENIINKVISNFNFTSFESKLIYSILSSNNCEEMKKIKKQKKTKKYFLIDFLPKENYLNLLLINKELNKFYYKKIYRKLFNLNRNESFIQKENIYFSLLKYNNIKTIFNYKEILNQYLNDLKNNNLNKNSDTINLDVVRTFFSKEQKENEEKLRNILQSLTIIFPKNGYIQGMNFLCSYFLESLNFDEEKTFYFMAALFTNSEYLNLFDNQFELLQMFFFCIEQILYIFLPNVYNLLKNNKVYPNCYSSTWFITLFTYENMKLNKNKITLFIIENFILEGWKAILITGFTLINNYKNVIFNIKKESLSNFFNKDLVKLKFFTDENLNVFIEQYFINKKKINKDLMKNLKNLYKYSNNL